MTIQNYFFDLGGVLMDLDVNRTLKAMAALSRHHGADSGFAAQDLFGVGENRLMQDYQDGKIDTGQFLDALYPMCRPGVSREALIEAWDAMLLGIPQRRLEAIRNLRRKGKQVFILSNINEEHLRWSRIHFDHIGLRIGDDVTHAFFSNEMGVSKPDPYIFREAIRQSGVDPAETLYIDDMQVNVDAGARWGLQTLCARGDEWFPAVCI
ncbi:MAG: HAD-superfamily hydrolase [bacterium P3]|nr:MAG: HAD-superfamily hydrolase [bacterium P3]KWW42125.1 MAG: HAD-superfamily hydrolase [bacterium F083]